MPTVLVVDDHAGFRAFARVYLTSSGFQVVGEATDGVGAIAETLRLAPEVVLLDIQLPDIDGFEVSRRLAKAPIPPAVVLTSTREATEYGSKIDTSGARGFLSKAELTGDALWTLVE